MKIGNQVVSLELAKQLKELGAEQDSIFWWVKHIKSGTNYHIWDLVFGKDENDLVNEYISAYTVAELGEMLPTFYTSWSTAETWACGDELDQHGSKGYEAKTEADARAKMVTSLLKGKVIKAKGVEH